MKEVERLKIYTDGLKMGDEGKGRTVSESQASDLNKWVFHGAIYKTEKAVRKISFKVEQI